MPTGKAAERNKKGKGSEPVRRTPPFTAERLCIAYNLNAAMIAIAVATISDMLWLRLVIVIPLFRQLRGMAQQRPPSSGPAQTTCKANLTLVVGLHSLQRWGYSIKEWWVVT